MDDQNKNLILATALSFLVIMAWFILFPPEQPTTVQEPSQITSQSTGNAPIAAEPQVSATPSSDIAEVVDASTNARISIETPEISGSISLTGGRLDDLSLKGYRQKLDAGSDIVTLLRPQGQSGAYQALYGWAPGGSLDTDNVPNANTVWTAEQGAFLTPESPVTLSWTSPIGLEFRREISVDEHFMFTVAQSVTNNTSETHRLAPETQLERFGRPDDLKGFFIIHEGALRQNDEEREYFKYNKLEDMDGRDDLSRGWSLGGNVADVKQITGNGWIGFTDHYWMTTIIPNSDQAFTSVFQYDTLRDIYRTRARLATISVAPGQTQTVETRLFAGAKRWETIRAYERENGVTNFLDSIDWGWFFFLTKPIFSVLHWLNGIIGNMGWSILALTLLIKALLFPLAYKSYVSMAKMKELQPEMEKLKERAGEDRQKLQQEMMALYKKEKVNPASGCLPIILQIPIFFSLYKVIFVTIELRHAPWIGWIKDLSAPDPSSLFNLWGIFPWAGPEPGSILALAFIGILPLLLGISMWVQQKLNPAPTDPTQKMIFAWMPWVFMFMLGSFASGLVIYWIANNTITFTQQYIIMRSQGYKPDVFGNIISSFKRKTKGDGK